MNGPLDWFTPLILLVVFGTFILRDVARDKTPRLPKMQWWNNRREPDWWTKRPHRLEKALMQRKHEVRPLELVGQKNGKKEDS